MAANPKQIMFITLILAMISGCTLISEVETPKSWGEAGGKAGAQMWIEEYGKSGYPSTESSAAYCVDISEDGMKRFDWSFEQAMESTEACVKSFVDGLS